MIVYLGFAVALAAAGSHQRMPGSTRDVSPAASTPALSGDAVFFTPAGASVRRDDI
jgi:hypothetical protein